MSIQVSHLAQYRAGWSELLNGLYRLLTSFIVFENEDDAERYAIQLEAMDHKKDLELMEVDPDIIAMNCVNYNYRFTIIKSNELIVPLDKE
jgi:hypothetical protein